MGTAVVKLEPENTASARVALRTGFTYAGRLREQNDKTFRLDERALVEGQVVRVA